MSEHTSDSRRTDQGNCVDHCGRTNVLRCEAIADQTDTQNVRVTVRRLLERASSWRVQAASERVRVSPPRSEQWRERMTPPELMGESSRTVLTSKQTSQILEQIGTEAKARTTFSNSATGVTCEGKQIESVAKPDDPGGTQQEQNPAEVRGQDLGQDTETEAHTSESLTMWLRQMQQRRVEGQRKALTCLTQKSLKKRHRTSHGGDGEDCDECNNRGQTPDVMVKKL